METQFKYLDILKEIADDTRMSILQSLKEGPLTVSEIEEKTGKSHSTTSQQLKRMLNAKLLSFRQDGTRKYYQLRDNQIFNMLDAITSFLSTSDVLSSDIARKGKKVMLMGLDKSGKTSILLSFLGKKNLISYMDSNLKATRGNKHMSEILQDLNQKYA
jgi:DNA-binding transcriptional ArsR family regulator